VLVLRATQSGWPSPLKSATTAIAAAGVGVGVGVGVAVAVGLGLGVAVGVELGRGVAVGVELGRGVAVGVGVGDRRRGRWRQGNHSNRAHHVAASAMRGAVVGKRPSTIEGASEGRSLVTKSRIPDAVRHPRGA